MLKQSWINAPKETPKDKVGFVYQITQLKTGLKYIGIKKFWTKKGKETNWKTYKSSGAKLKGIDVNNPKKYKKEILYICDTITDMKVKEAWLQLDYYISGNWSKLMNEVINLRVRIRK